jgi:hypothetical protein
MSAVAYDSPSYFNDTQTRWHCPLTPRQVDDAIMRAEAMRQGKFAAKLGPVRPETRVMEGGNKCDCRELPHSVRCAIRFAPPKAGPTPDLSGTFTWDEPLRGRPSPFASPGR